VSKGFTPVIAGSALGNTVAAPVSPKNIPNRGGEMNPSVDALRRQFSNAVRRADVVWGETTVIVDGARVRGNAGRADRADRLDDAAPHHDDAGIEDAAGGGDHATAGQRMGGSIAPRGLGGDEGSRSIQRTAS